MLRKLFSRGTFARDLLQNDKGQVIEWWETRRLFFNVVVGCTGILTCAALIACALQSEPRVGEAIGLPNPPVIAIFGIFAFGVAANICYTGGWIAELVLSKLRPGADTTRLGLRAFRFGLDVLDLHHSQPGHLVLDHFRHRFGKRTEARASG